VEATDFLPPRVLRGRHAQSIFGSVGLRRARVYAAAQPLLAASFEEVVDAGQGVRLLLAHTPPRANANGRTVTLFHGWEGSAVSTYVLSAATRLWREGYRIVRVNFRDHGDSHHLNEELFHSCRLDEAIGAVQWVQSEFPDESLMLAGFSLGGNFSLRIAARASIVGLNIAKVVAICPVLDPQQTMWALDEGSMLYRTYFIRRWRRSLERKKAAFPRRYDFKRLARFGTLREMTDYFVCHYTDYPDLKTYLRGYAITDERLDNLSVPSAMLLAEDDPVIPIADLPRVSRSPQLGIRTTRFGGHCGFLTDLKFNTWTDDYLLDQFSNADAGPAISDSHSSAR
jgi:predicted alpha/beta-fold hydrolase